MNKNKLIALAIILFLILVPFHFAYIDFTIESQVSQVLTMTIVIIGSIVAILMFNKKTDDGSHH